MTAGLLIATVRKYTRAKRMSERRLNELIERIEVHQAEKADGVQVQRLTIHYNCVGTIGILIDCPFRNRKLSYKREKE